MDLPVRVLHVVVNMNRGGAETLIMNLYRNIDRTKIQFDFLTCKKGIFDEEIESLDGRLHRIPYITEGGPFKYNKALENFFKTHPEYKIVHSHLDKMSGLVLHSAKRAGVPIRIAHSHNTRSEGNLLAKGIKWFAGNLILQKATDYLACSKAASQWLFKQRSNQTFILKNSIDLHTFKSTLGIREKIREQYNIKKDHFVIGHVGRFCHQKNHDFLIDIFFNVLRINPDAILVLVGEGPLKDKVRRKAANMGLLNNVLFLGIKENIQEILQAFDCMVFPSHHEGLPVTLIEAQSVGLPCLISDRITNEVDVEANLIKYESLEKAPVIWALKALLLDGSIKDTSSFIRNHGYDIEKTAIWLQTFYLSKTFGNSHSQKKVKVG